MASMGAAMASAILCIHRNRNTVRYRLAAHRSSLGATLGLMMVGCVLVGSTYGCGRMHGKHGSSHGKCNLVHSSQPQHNSASFSGRLVVRRARLVDA